MDQLPGTPAESDAGCLQGADAGGAGALIDPNYKTPCALQVTAGVEHAFNRDWTLSTDFTHEEGNHAYRRYDYMAGYSLFSPQAAHDVAAQRALVPDISDFRTDNRSRFNGVQTTLDQFRGSPYLQVDLRVSRPFLLDHVTGTPFIEFFNVFNRQLRVPAGALGDFFGPGTTVGIPVAAQLGFRLNF